MQLLFVLFSIIALGIFFGAHYFFYYSFVRFFEITSLAGRNVTLGIVILLSLSFFIATLAAHFREGIITRTIYLLSGLWLGLLVNLILASILGWLALWLAGLMGYNLNSSLVGLVLFGLAFVYSAYGIWNAFNPQVKNIQVTIKNLPDQWKGKTIVQLSDVHLGHIYQADFLQKVVEETNNLHPAAVVITGDLFDGMDGNLENLIGPINSLQAPEGVYFITGNHETYLGVDKAFSVLEKTKVRILQNEVLDVNGLKLIGINYPDRGAASNEVNILQSLKNKFSGQPNILLYHSPVNIMEAKEAGVDLQLSGHTHVGQIFPFEFVTHLIYRGYDYGLHTLGDCTIYTTNGIGTWGPAMRTGNTPEIVNITLN